MKPSAASAATSASAAASASETSREEEEDGGGGGGGEQPLADPSQTARNGHDDATYLLLPRICYCHVFVVATYLLLPRICCGAMPRIYCTMAPRYAFTAARLIIIITNGRNDWASTRSLTAMAPMK